MDSTVVDSNIHHPTDSTLLQDGIRVITRLLQAGKFLQLTPGYRFADHQRAAKKRVMVILNARKENQRIKAYRELLTLATKVQGYGVEAHTCLRAFASNDLEEIMAAHQLLARLEQALNILKRVLDQTERRVLRKEKVSAAEKLVSFFECHTDIIVKGGRDTQYGHKVFLTGGSSGLILDCLVQRGNSADATLFPVMLDRQQNLFQRPPRQVASDGGFASRDNLHRAKARGIEDVAFARKRGLSVLDMVKSHWVFKKLRNFRAGIEANISRLKRAFGLARCTWSGWPGLSSMCGVRSFLTTCWFWAWPKRSSINDLPRFFGPEEWHIPREGKNGDDCDFTLDSICHLIEFFHLLAACYWRTAILTF